MCRRGNGERRIVRKNSGTARGGHYSRRLCGEGKEGHPYGKKGELKEERGKNPSEQKRRTKKGGVKRGRKERKNNNLGERSLKRFSHRGGSIIGV